MYIFYLNIYFVMIYNTVNNGFKKHIVVVEFFIELWNIFPIKMGPK